MITTASRIYTDETQTTIVTAETEGARLLAGEWDQIEDETALALGLLTPDGATHSQLSAKRRKNREAAKED
jgi:hypothetical protein